MPMKLRIWRNNQFTSWRPNVWDVIVLLLVFSVFVILAWEAKQMATPYQIGDALPISLTVYHLPAYALRTVFRMAIAMIASLIFTFAIGSLAAKNKHAERIIIPLIDVLQSVPVLGFLSITIVWFMALFPRSLLGPECAAIFAIFTSQAWNMCLGFYQSLRTVPYDLREASAIFQLSAWQRFWRVEVPFAMPSLIWNMMMSMSAGWFFVVTSEAISVNNQSIMLPGIGSYIRVAIAQADKNAVLYAILVMLLVIVLYDQILFRPLIAWSEKFKGAEGYGEHKTGALLITLLRRTRLLYYLGHFFSIFLDAIVNFRSLKESKTVKRESAQKTSTTNFWIYLWYSIISIIGLIVLFFLLRFIFKAVSVHEIPHLILLGVYTSIKVVILIVICTLVWVPIGVWIGLRPRVAQVVQPIAQFFAAFPAYLFFPVVVMIIVTYHLNTQIWTTPLMILGTQWYILFNVIAGTTALPKELVQVAQNFGVKKWLWWKRFIFPGIFPYYVTGAITAAGGAWNASIVAEYVNWGHTTLTAAGLGSYITEVTHSGDFPRVALGIGMMCLFVLLFNRLLWQPLYNLAERRFQVE